MTDKAAILVWRIELGLSVEVDLVELRLKGTSPGNAAMALQKYVRCDCCSIRQRVATLNLGLLTGNKIAPESPGQVKLYLVLVAI